MTDRKLTLSPLPSGRFAVQAIEQILFGMPLEEAIMAEVERYGAARVFVTSTRSLSQLENGPLQRAIKALGSRHVGTYSRISAHSPREDVIAGANAARAADADLMVAVGGGSVIDATKAMLTKRTPLVSGRSTLRDHHYIKDETLAAKLFASGKNKSNPENDVMYKALNQCLNALVGLRGRGALTRAPQHQQHERPILETVEMPIVLVNSFSKCHQVEIQNEDTATPIAKNFQLEVNYAFAKVDKPVSEFFLIDIVELGQLDAFLNTVDKDVEAMLLTIPED